LSARHRDAPEYWDARAAAVLDTPGEAAAVCEAALLVGGVAPIEERGARQVAAHLPAGGRTLEVGCGYGRWFDLLGRDRRLIGLDRSGVMARSAARRRPDVPVLRGDARRLPFAAGSLDAAYTMKVLQLLPEADRPGAVAGILRSVRVGGTVVLFEKMATPDGSPAGDWIGWAEQAGGRLVRWYGNQFAPLDRGLAGVIRAIRPVGRPALGPDAPGVRERHPGWFRLYERVRRAELRLGLPLEPLLERTLPGRWAEHGIFVFERTR
jgi:SAM-dependent methyltransferase